MEDTRIRTSLEFFVRTFVFDAVNWRTNTRFLLFVPKGRLSRQQNELQKDFSFFFSQASEEDHEKTCRSVAHIKVCSSPARDFLMQRSLESNKKSGPPTNTIHKEV